MHPSADVSEAPYLRLLTDALVDEGVSVRRLRPSALLRERRAVVHIHWPEHLVRGNGSVARRAAKQLWAVGIVMTLAFRPKIRIVRTLHNRRPHKASTNPIERLVTSFIEKRTSATIVLVPEHADVTMGDTAVWIPSGLTPTTPAVGPNATLRKGPLKLLSVGVLSEYRLTPELVDALRPALETGEVELVLAGPASTEVLERIGAGNTDGLTVRPGWRDEAEIAALAAESDLLVGLQARPFNTGLPYLALASNRPAILSSSQQADHLAELIGADWVRSIDDETDSDEWRRLLTRPLPTGTPTVPEEMSWSAIGAAHRDLYQRVTRPQVVILNRYIAHYRTRFYELLKAESAERGVWTRVMTGTPWGGEETNVGSVASAGLVEPFANRTLTVRGHTIVWQPVFARTTGADLILTEQQAKFFSNHLLQIRGLLGGAPVGFFGHGRNLQSDRHGLVERAKAQFTKRAAWFMAYTEGAAEIVENAGLPSHKVSVFHNGLDTVEREEQRRSVTIDVLSQRRAELGIEDAAHVYVYAGRVYPDKRPEFLSAAVDELLRRDDKAVFVCVGSGSEALRFSDDVTDRVRLVGPRFDRDFTVDVLLGEMLLMPAAVGLAAVESLVLGRPIVTLDDAGHGPEIEYLRPGVDSVVLAANTTVDEYVAQVERLVNDRPRLAAMQDACLERAHDYGLEQMAKHFAEGLADAVRHLGR